MSAYMVDREHIGYLVEAACAYRLHSYAAHHLGIATQNTDAIRVAIANALQDANAKSITARYPDTDGHLENAPGDTTAYEPYTASELNGMMWARFDPVQVLKACRCFEYQACEFDEWEDSAAKRLIDSIVAHAVGELPGYEAAEWGAPEPRHGLIKLSTICKRK